MKTKRLFLLLFNLMKYMFLYNDHSIYFFSPNCWYSYRSWRYFLSAISYMVKVYLPLIIYSDLRSRTILYNFKMHPSLLSSGSFCLRRSSSKEARNSSEFKVASSRLIILRLLTIVSASLSNNTGLYMAYSHATLPPVTPEEGLACSPTPPRTFSKTPRPPIALHLRNDAETSA